MIGIEPTLPGEVTTAGDVHELLDRLGADQLHLIGPDIGVMVAHAVAAQGTEQVTTLTILDVPIPRTQPGT